MAASLPGVQLRTRRRRRPDGFSVLGLGADQNSTTLNGMQLRRLEPSARRARSRARSSRRRTTCRAADSAARRFNIAQPSGIELHHAQHEPQRRRAALQWTDRAARALGQQYSNFSLGGLCPGPIEFDKAFYNIVVPARPPRERSADAAQHRSDRPAGAGVVVRFGRAPPRHLSSTRVPLTVGTLADNRIGDQGSLFGSFDFAPPSSTRAGAQRLVQRQLEQADAGVKLADASFQRTAATARTGRRTCRGATHRTSASDSERDFARRQRVAELGTPYLADAERARCA